MKTNAECGMRNAEVGNQPRAIELARALYAQHGGDLEKDLREYAWPNGIIVDLPGCFAIAYACKTESGEYAWFVKVATGNLAQLLLLFPIQLPFVTFHRARTGQLKSYRTATLIRMARKLSHSAFRIPTSHFEATK